MALKDQRDLGGREETGSKENVTMSTKYPGDWEIPA